MRETISDFAGNLDRQNQDPNTPANPFVSYVYIRFGNTIGDGRLADGTVPSSDVSYLSPDIAFHPTDPYGNAVVGSAVTIEALIHNDGPADALPVEVEFWWFDPSLALTAGNGHQLKLPSKQTLVAVPHGQYLKVTCPVIWQPQFVNGGHECLLVQCSCPSDGKGNLKYPFDVGLDRHVGQRNLTVVPPGTPMQLRLNAPNPFSSSADFRVYVASTLVSTERTLIRSLDAQTLMSNVAQAAMGGAGRDSNGQRLSFRTTDATSHGFGVVLSGMEQTTMKGRSRDQEEQTTLSALARARQPQSVVPAGRILGEFDLAHGKMAVLDIVAPPTDGGQDSFLVHHFTQVFGGIILGGYGVVVPPRGFGKQTPNR